MEDEIKTSIGGVPEYETSYPPTKQDIKETQRAYRDDAAAEMFIAAGGRQLQKSATTMSRALTRQAEKLEEFHSTPFSEQNVQTIKTTLEALERTQSALERWHYLIYPNQRVPAPSRLPAPPDPMSA